VKKRLEQPITYVIVLIVWLIILIGLLCSYWMWDWQVITAIATWVLAGGIGVAIWQIIVTRRNTKEQLEETRKSTNAQVAVSIFQELHSKETMKIISRIYHHESQPIQIKDLSSYERKNIYYVLDRFEMLGALVFNRIIDKQLAIEVGAGLRALRCWYKLYKFIGKERRKRGYFAEYYEAFTRKCLDYIKGEGIEAKFYTEDEKGKVIDTKDLKKELQKKKLHPRSLEEIKGER